MAKDDEGCANCMHYLIKGHNFCPSCGKEFR